ncbi:polyphenol oxidase [Cucumis melo var. makuwa]|uniref:Polyphenol oxidase, chloroplastic-like n=2 Tax=Cucumis melo TaxID=3656 RepID=A0A1S3B632_CUCME|nr:polyphenol oxidase, chloroplastic-like [Cucumis melo]KAA0056968.1 polyphenol oxidase [Cucumis melo var. makuwa]TYK26394.1 polyphenol oxidase [Cucumis melo var. makuwa]
MAFLSHPPSLTLTPFLHKTKTISITSRISCKASNHNDQNTSNPKIDRRDILIGLTGLYGSSTLSQSPHFALAAPIQTPNISKCGPPDLPPGADPTNCCPPPATTILDFQPPPPTKLRVRPAAHLADQNYIEKYKKAIELMKALPEDDPRSFTQQANVHCAYCNGAYDQIGFPVEVQVHNSWLFFPFHRFYLYFHEKILGELIGDSSFALPFWNYDAPGGMKMPRMYAEEKSSLYDELRNENHLPPRLVDLDFGGVDDPNIGDDAQIRSNLSIMYRQMVSGSRTPSLFFGSAYVEGDEPSPGGGSVENIPHGPVHVWCGDNDQPNFENMGNFYSAARDPIFFAHHSNVDRLWSVWKTLGGRRKDLQNPEWLNASFIFYNEKAQPVRVHVRDCLDSKSLGYTYQPVDLPWLQTRPTPRRAQKTTVAFGIASALAAGPSSSRVKPANIKFPITVKSPVSVEVKRPKKSRSKKEKEEEEEVLVIYGIGFDPNNGIKFDVFINDEDDKEIKPDNTEFAGSFVNVPHKQAHKKKVKTGLRVGITEVLEDLEADNDDSIIVTIVPKIGAGLFSIGGLKIELDE